MARTRLRCFFRLAAGPRIGFGHVMRARALADALGGKAVVSIRGGKQVTRDALRMGCAPVTGGPSRRTFDVLVVDDPSPAESARWVARGRRAGLLTVAIRDTGRYRHGADLVVNGRVGARPARGGGASAVGARFCIITPRLRRVRRRPRAAARRLVLVTLGGGGHVRRAGPLIARAIADRCPGLRIRVAAGLSRRSRRPRLRVGEWFEGRLLREFGRCDVAVVGGGVTLHEACALGVPAVGLAVVPAQRAAIQALARRGAAIDAGALDPAGIGRAADAVQRLVNDPEARRRIAHAARSVLDARGADRVAALIRRMAARGTWGPK